MMNVKQAAGWMLLMVMLMTAYGLFGVGSVGHTPVVQINSLSQNKSVTPEISAGHYDYETHVTVDIGCIFVMVILMIITSWGSLPRMRIEPEKGSKEELEETEMEEKE